MMELGKLIIIIYIYSARVSAEELCVSDTFNASCNSSQIVYIETAFYGRMNNSKCFNMTENETDCVVDFRIDIQKQFGLKQNIHFKLVSTFFTENKPRCVEGRPPFLHITHRCSILNSQETCVWETFNAVCPPGTVIFIQSALYGRMRSSQCIKFDKTGLDCRAYVQPYLESQCNGRSECHVSAADERLKGAESTCQKHLEPYLEVEYTCVHGFSCPPFQPQKDVNIYRTSDGYQVLCPNDTNVKNLSCKDGSWSRDPEKICPTKESNWIQIVMFTIPAAVLLLSIVSVAILLNRMQEKAQRRKTRVDDEYTDYPESHLRRNGATCASQYDEYGEIDDCDASYSVVRDTGP